MSNKVCLYNERKRAQMKNMLRDLDLKYYIDTDGNICRKGSDEPIPLDEPIFLLRARDPNAVLLLQIYTALCEKAECVPGQILACRELIRKFVSFSVGCAARMHLPTMAAPIPQPPPLFSSQPAPQPLMTDPKE
jgi:hypothetical protein